MVKITGEHKEDIQRMIKVLAENGYFASIEECELLWSWYSDSNAASWLILPDSDDQLFQNLVYIGNISRPKCS